MNIKAKILFFGIAGLFVLLGVVSTWYLFKPPLESDQVAEEASNSVVIEKSLQLNASVKNDLGDWEYYPGDFSKKALLGMSLPGTWRPYSESSIWNTPIAEDVIVDPESDSIVRLLKAEAENVRFVSIYSSPIWVVNSENMSQYQVKSDRIFDLWDKNLDGWSDDPIPIDRDMWGEQSEDGHIIIVDPFKMLAWEMSSFKWSNTVKGPVPTGTTLNIWDLKGPGYAQPFEGKRWHQRGGRGSGFPILAGIIRPEEIAEGEIRHALVFMFNKNRKGGDDQELFIAPPAVRSDGEFQGEQFPIEGMRFQLNPKLTDADFDDWGLTKEAKIVAHALQRYGMYLGDNGGAMSIGVQLMARDEQSQLQYWNNLFPDLYRSIKKIPTAQFRLISTAFPTSG